MALLLPGPRWLGALGGNLAVFFGGLYAAARRRRGGGAGGRRGHHGAGSPSSARSLVLLFLAPVAALAALALGVTDTWVDWRPRLARSAGRPLRGVGRWT